MPRLLTAAEVARLLQVRPRLLADWRRQNVGPRWAKVGHYVRYESADLRAWVDSTKSRHEGDSARVRVALR